jgi:prepilin-type N-terminal cleavage/methylation domain-containing protein
MNRHHNDAVLNEGTRMNTKKIKQGGFTLIELLIVIGLMGALTALILPRLSADREEAMGDVCDYNQAGSVRVLTQYNDIFGAYPAGMHNGLGGTDVAAVAIEGLPDAQLDHMVTDIATTRHALTADQAASLVAAGITNVASGTGYNLTEVEEDVNLAAACAADGSNPWNDDGGVEMTFDGVAISDWATATGTPSWDASGGPVVCLWITPTVDWESAQGDGGNSDWTKGAVEYGISMEGKCPIPTAAASGDEVSFAYYMAYFKVYDDGTPARMIGSTCPECGVLNP